MIHTKPYNHKALTASTVFFEGMLLAVFWFQSNVFRGKSMISIFRQKIIQSKPLKWLKPVVMGFYHSPG
jgi:hypothetical protein